MNNQTIQFDTSVSSNFSLTPNSPRCDSCGHQRGEHEHNNSPKWACPACGVSYGLKNLSDGDTGNFFATRMRVTPAPELRQAAMLQTKNPHSHQSSRKTKSAAGKQALIRQFSVFVLCASMLISVMSFYNHSNIIEQKPMHKTSSESKPLHLLDEKDTLVKR